MHTTKNREIIKNAKVFMDREKIDAWVLYDFKGSNPFFWRLIGKRLSTTRQCFLFVRKVGRPRILANSLDRRLFRDLELPIIEFSSRDEMEKKLEDLTERCAVIAMEYSPRANVPYVSRVDAGTIELFREKGVRIVSSGDLFQYSAARWTKEELKAHLGASKKISMIKDEAFEFARKKVASQKPMTEFDIQDLIVRRFVQENMITEDRPIVAVNESSADPHYEPTEDNCVRIGQGDLLMLDMWAKTSEINGVYADITWMAYFGREVPEEYAKVFDIVVEARDRVVAYLNKMLENNEPCMGWELDSVARDYISSKGYGDAFIHRTGHSIGASLHGDSVNLDNYESRDTRLIIPRIGFSVEPGIYLENWGIRSEINVYVNKSRATVTTPVQKSIVRLF